MYSVIRLFGYSPFRLFVYAYQIFCLFVSEYSFINSYQIIRLFVSAALLGSVLSVWNVYVDAIQLNTKNNFHAFPIGQH